MQPDRFVRETVATQRIGLKGKGAGALLAARALVPPDGANSWKAFTLAATDDGRLLRLGYGEYLIELDAGGQSLERLLGELPMDCHRLLRDDRCFLIGGAGCEAQLAQICNIDFARLDAGTGPVVLTLMAGVAVTVIKHLDGPIRYRIWCDPTFGDYLSSVLRLVFESQEYPL